MKMEFQFEFQFLILSKFSMKIYLMTCKTADRGGNSLKNITVITQRHAKYALLL